MRFKPPRQTSPSGRRRKQYWTVNGWMINSMHKKLSAARKTVERIESAGGLDHRIFEVRFIE